MFKYKILNLLLIDIYWNGVRGRDVSKCNGVEECRRIRRGL